MDTRNKRASAIGFGLAVLLVLPAPDGTIAQADRQHTAYSYAGISAEALSDLNLHVAETMSLMTDLSSASLMAAVETASLMGDRETEAI